MMPSTDFNPDWVSPPGDTVRDALTYRGLSYENLSHVLGLTGESIRALLDGELVVDDAIAQCLSGVLGGSPDFWLAREANYRVRLCERPSRVAPDFESFIKQLPLRDMKAFGWLAGLESLPVATAVRHFFEDIPGNWAISGAQIAEAVRFRTSTAHESNPAAVAAWLRQGVLQARSLDCAHWDPASLAESLPEIRALTRIKSPQIFFPKLIDLCRACGVAVVFVRTPNGCRASGATHFDSNIAIIQLSFRYRSDDHFWFTLFHEIGHLLLHPETPLFMEGQDYEGAEEESEANRFAADVLIPPELVGALGNVKHDFKAIMRFAHTIGVSPGVVVGQMQKRKLVRHNQFNFLKVRYDWETLGQINP
jgi:HTH-type transcriptional regulator / antitoxin HigA